MSIRFLSYPFIIRHAELVSASYLSGYEHITSETLKQVQGDVRFMTDYGNSKKNLIYKKHN